jgi:hypothetical protein
MKLARVWRCCVGFEVVMAVAIVAGIVAAAVPAMADTAAARRGALAASMISLGNAGGGYTISVTLAGSGMGSVGDDVGEILCPTDCDGDYSEEGQLVTLTALPEPGSYFAGWSGGGCSGTGPCVVSVTGGVTDITATFELDPVVTVSFFGSGTGEVEFSPGGGLCSSSCSPEFPPGTMITLTATPDPGSYFVGWSGAGCSGTGPCMFTLGTENVMVTATFALDPVVNLTIDGTGGGEVEFLPGGGLCSSSCAPDFPPGTMLTLTATAFPGSYFVGWNGEGCSGTGPCMFTLETAHASVTATFVANQPPMAVCRDVTIDATGSCVSLFIEAADVDDGSSDPDSTYGDSITLSLSYSGPFPIGQSTVTLTVTDLAGETSTCTATVTVLGNDCNNNELPDTCDIEAGSSLDCNDNWVPDECECYWCNVGSAFVVAPAAEVNAQVSHLGGGTECGEKVADDFYLEPGCAHRITAVRGRMLTTSNINLMRARLELYEDCNGKPADEPFFVADYQQDDPIPSEVLRFELGPDGESALVTYRFDLCDEFLWLEGGKTYWVSIIGLTDNVDMVDLSYWVAGSEYAPMLGNIPVKRSGTPGSTWGSCNFGPWESIEDCCIGCVNMDFCVDGYACPILWDNGKVDLVNRGGSPSGAHMQYHDRTADNFVVKTCRDEYLCMIEAWIWTNCDPVYGFVEIYEGIGCDPLLYDVPLASWTSDLSDGDSMDATRFDETLVVNGRTYYLWRLRVKDPGLTLLAGRNYWISAGAISTGNFTANSFFAWSQYGCDPCNGVNSFRITPGQHRTLRPPATEWADVNPARDFAFTIAVRAQDAIPQDTDGPPDEGQASPVCMADANNDGEVGVADIFAFLSAWFVGCP